MALSRSDHCIDHSGCTTDIKYLKEFRDEQVKPEGINEQLFNRVGAMEKEQAAIRGGWKTASWIIGALIALLSILVEYHFQSLHGSLMDVMKQQHFSAESSGTVVPSSKDKTYQGEKK